MNSSDQQQSQHLGTGKSQPQKHLSDAGYSAPLAIQNEDPVSQVHFGTDGWRAIIGKDFNTATVARVAEATARVYREDYPQSEAGAASLAANAASPANPLPAGATLSAATASGSALAPTTASAAPLTTPNTFYIGYDCRSNAGKYAALVAAIVSEHGFDVLLSDSYCPTPALCWSVARDPAAAGGIMLTSSHNPAEYLGIKLRMSDGGASPKEFSDRVEAMLAEMSPTKLPAAYSLALSVAEFASNGTPGQRAQAIPLKANISPCKMQE